MVSRLLSIVLISILLCLSSTALAETVPPIGILETRFIEVPAALSEQVRDIILDTLHQLGYRNVISEEQVQKAMREKNVPLGCAVGPCLVRLGKAIKAERALSLSMMASGSSSYDATLTMCETGGGTALAQVTYRCDVCSFRDVEKGIVASINKLQKRAQQVLERRGALVVTSDPPMARVVIDGLTAGKTRMKRILPPGVYTVEVVAPDHLTAKQEIELLAGATRELHLKLMRADAIPVEPVLSLPPPKPSRIRPWFKWAALGSGIALAGTGAILWSLDGRGDLESVPNNSVGTTREQYTERHTAGWGIGLVSVGAVSLVASGILWWWEKTHSPLSSPASAR